MSTYPFGAIPSEILQKITVELVILLLAHFDPIRPVWARYLYTLALVLCGSLIFRLYRTSLYNHSIKSLDTHSITSLYNHFIIITL